MTSSIYDKVPAMNFTIKASIGLLIFLGLLGYGIYWYANDDSADAVVYKTTPIQRGELMASIGANGTV